MSMRDGLDTRRARHFAWKLARPGETIDLTEIEAAATTASEQKGEAAAGEASAQTAVASEEQDGRAWAREAYEACSELAAAIDRVWEMADPASQAMAVGRLAEQAQQLGLSLMSIQNYPLQSVRLARLAVRHLDRLDGTARRAVDHLPLWLDFTHPSAEDLLVEVARMGNRDLADALQLALVIKSWGEEVPHRPDFAARLASIIEHGPTWACRTIALDWLGHAPGKAAVQTLRRALRMPHIGVRWRALRILLELPPPTLEPEDVLFMLEDAVRYPPPDEEGEELRRAVPGYAEDLETAVARLKPPGGAQPLLRIVRDDCANAYYRDWRALDRRWGLEVLAAAYPEAALPLVDAHLDHLAMRERAIGLEAAARLPLELARPRLLAAAADGAPEVAERARDLWIEHVGGPCPVEELAGLPLEWLAGPPSERLRTRLGVLRGPSAEARRTMAEVLLAEAPDREALTLLVFALDDERLWQGGERPGLPRNRDEWARTLCQRFGAAGVEALLWLARRRSRTEYDAWQSKLSRLVRDGVIARSEWPQLRDFALTLLDARERDQRWQGLEILRETGAPPASFDRLWSIFEDEREPWHIVSEIFRRWPEDKALDERLERAMREALASGDDDRYLRLAGPGFSRSFPPALELAEHMLALWGTAEQAGQPVPSLDVVCSCAIELFRAGRLGDVWILEHLGDPAGRYFPVACAVASVDFVHRPAARLRALRAALLSPAREGAAAAEAAEALLRLQRLSPRSLQLRAIFNAAPLRARSDLLGMLIVRSAPLTPLWPAIAELLRADDPVVISSMSHRVRIMRVRHIERRLYELLPEIRSPELRDEIEDFIQLPAPWESYWQDEPRDD